MRRFRFVGDPSEYADTKPVVGQDYDEHTIETKWGTTGCSTIDMFPNEWQEVFDQKNLGCRVESNDMHEVLMVEPKNLHKDTDLGMFTLGIINGTISNQLMVDSMSDQSRQFLVENAILLAKELIKQLNEETK